jgi:hypothetical protein
MSEIVFWVTVAVIHGTSPQVTIAALSTALQAGGDVCLRAETVYWVTVAVAPDLRLSPRLPTLRLVLPCRQELMCVSVLRLCTGLPSQLLQPETVSQVTVASLGTDLQAVSDELRHHALCVV